MFYSGDMPAGLSSTYDVNRQAVYSQEKSRVGVRRNRRHLTLYAVCTDVMLRIAPAATTIAGQRSTGARPLSGYIRLALFSSSRLLNWLTDHHESPQVLCYS
jgi:hypothetical protein